MRTSSLFLFLACLFASSSSYAGPPALFQTCQGLNQVNGVGLVLFDADCKSAYLLPSPNGTLKITGIFLNISDADCKAVQEAEAAGLGAFGDATDRKTKRDALQAEIKKLDPDLQAASNATSVYNLIKTKLASDLNQATKELDGLSTSFASDCWWRREQELFVSWYIQ